MMGKVIMSGIVPPLVPPFVAPVVTGIFSGDLAVGSVVKLIENGVATEYLVVNQGKPSGSSLYDDSCDGTWLLRNNIYENREWHSSRVNDYENSTIQSYLNSTFLNLFDANTKSIIKQVKIPYRKGSGKDTTVTSGTNGLSAKIFLLSATEVSFSSNFMPSSEGMELSYFSGCSDTSSDNKRVSKLNGTAIAWWLRSPFCHASLSSTISICVSSTGGFSNDYCNGSHGIRPALILPKNAIFDETTLILKGVD